MSRILKEAGKTGMTANPDGGGRESIVPVCRAGMYEKVYCQKSLPEMNLVPFRQEIANALRE